jgi:hypothetical protein
MPIKFAIKDENIALIRVTGILEKSEFDQAQRGIASLIQSKNKIRILIITQDFEGWEKSEEWQDTSSIGPNDSFIEKIAIVGDPKWKDLILLFSLKDMRSIPIEFFNAESTAQNWLDSE